MGGRVVSDWREYGDETVSELVTFGGATAALVAAEALFGAGSGVRTGLVYAVIAVGLLVLVQYRPAPASSLYQSLLLLPVLRIVQLGFPLVADNSVATLASVYSLALLSAFVLARDQHLSAAALGLTRRDARLVPAGLLVGGLLGALLRVVHPATQLSGSLDEYRLGLLVAVGVLVAFVEAFLFRGLVQRWADVVLGKWVAVVAASLLATVGRLVWVTPTPLVESAIFALVVGWLYAETENLWFVASIQSALTIVIVAGAA